MIANIFTIKKCQVTPSYSSYQPTTQSNPNSQNFASIIEFGWQIANQFDKSHIQGAIYIDSEQVQSSPEWLLKSQEEIRDVFRKHLASYKCNNIRIQKILVYNRHVKQMSILPACRLAILLLHFNICELVDVMLGGYQEYLCSQSQSITLIRVSRKPLKEQHQKNHYKLIISYEQLRNYKNSQLVDTRTKQQHEGLISGYSYWQLKGKIPESIFHGGNISKNSCQVKEYSPSGQFLKMWEQQNIDTNKHIILYCGTGWRASQIIIYAILNGVSNISLYSNGWVEWSKKNNYEQKPMKTAGNSEPRKCIKNMNSEETKKQGNSLEKSKRKCFRKDNILAQQ